MAITPPLFPFDAWLDPCVAETRLFVDFLFDVLAGTAALEAAHRPGRKWGLGKAGGKSDRIASLQPIFNPSASARLLPFCVKPVSRDPDSGDLCVALDHAAVVIRLVSDARGVYGSLGGAHAAARQEVAMRRVLAGLAIPLVSVVPAVLIAYRGRLVLVESLLNWTVRRRVV